MEVHLEEFIDQNWEKLNFGSKLHRYRTEEQNGRQFPAGTWSIDFLCVDRESGDFVVIELKDKDFFSTLLSYPDSFPSATIVYPLVTSPFQISTPFTISE